MMHGLSGQLARAKTLGEIINAPASTNACAHEA